MKIFNNGGSGSAPAPSLPWENIVISGEDLTKYGYVSLDVNRIFTKSQAPKLYQIYKKFNGNFIFDGQNTVSFETVQISKNFYMAVDLVNSNLIFADSITFNNSVVFDYSPFVDTFDDWYFVGNRDGALAFVENSTSTNEYVDIFQLMTFNKDAADLTEFLNSIQIFKRKITDWRMSYESLFFTNNYIITKVSDQGGGFDTSSGVIFAVDLNSLLDEEPSFAAGAKAIKLGQINTTNNFDYNILLKNDALIYNGILYKLPDLTPLTIDAIISERAFTVWHDNETKKDFFCYSRSSGIDDKLQGLGTWDGENFELLPLNYGADYNENLMLPICYIDKDNFLDGNFESCNLIRKDGVRVSLDDSIGVNIYDFFAIEGIGTTSRATYSSKKYFYYRFDNSLIFRDKSTNTAQKVLVLETESETFEIKAMLTRSDDKKYWIKVE